MSKVFLTAVCTLFCTPFIVFSANATIDQCTAWNSQRIATCAAARLSSNKTRPCWDTASGTLTCCDRNPDRTYTCTDFEPGIAIGKTNIPALMLEFKCTSTGKLARDGQIVRSTRNISAELRIRLPDLARDYCRPKNFPASGLDWTLGLYEIIPTASDYNRQLEHEVQSQKTLSRYATAALKANSLTPENVQVAIEYAGSIAFLDTFRGVKEKTFVSGRRAAQMTQLQATLQDQAKNFISKRDLATYFPLLTTVMRICNRTLTPSACPFLNAPTP